VRVDGASAEEMFLEVELDVCVLLDYFENLGALCDNLKPLCELFLVLW
jgi:hypothetical protein